MAIVDRPNLTECLVEDGKPDRPNGWFLKWLDTGETFHRVAGEWIDWGLGMSFAPPTKSGIIVTDNDGVATIDFITPFVDNNYSVQLTLNDEGVGGIVGLISTQTAGGFSIRTVDTDKGKPVRDVTVAWLATRSFNA